VKGLDTCVGYVVVRRQRVGTLLANAMEGFGAALIFPTPEEAEEERGGLSFPNDWDVLRVEVRLTAGAPVSGEGEGK